MSEVPLLTVPMCEALAADYELFCQVRVDPASGTIVWPNGADISLPWPTCRSRTAPRTAR